MESVVNTAIGFCISYVGWLVIAPLYGIPMTTSSNLQIIGWFTIISVARQYVLRRCFNGRTPWAAIKGQFA